MDAKFNNTAEHPGVFIRDELEAREWTQIDLAYVLGCSVQTVNKILSGKSGVTADMAVALGEAFGTSAELFANMQKAWELGQAKAADPSIAKRSHALSSYPVKQMIQRGWIHDTGSDMLEMQLCSFFEQSTLEQVPHMAHAAKKTSYDDFPAKQVAWLFRVRQIAKEMIVADYKAAKLKKALSLLSELRSSPEEIRHVPRILSEAGVRFVIVEGLSGGRIDGVCTWLDAKSPVIGMSLRYPLIDTFWFTLAHECAHIIEGHGKKVAIIDEDVSTSNAENEEEVIANHMAAQFCVDQEMMQSFFNRKNPYFSDKDLRAFSKRVGTHPGIVAGQIQRRTGKWGLFKKHQVNVRNFITDSAVTDGWGTIAPTEN